MFVELMAMNLVLEKWRQNPMATKMEIGVWQCWQQGEENGHPQSESEVQKMKEFLPQPAPTSYFKVFPEEWDGCLTIG
jgi:hypothetical protein